MTFQDQRSDISYGRRLTDADLWGYMVLPTPGTLNTVAYDGAVADTKFSQNRGFYDAPLTVTITTKTTDADIYYTTDGSGPLDLARNVPSGHLYTGPIPITTTTCLRAVAYKPGWVPTNVDTHTYLFLADVITQATNPQTGAQVVPPGLPATWPGGSYSGAARGTIKWTRISSDKTAKTSSGSVRQDYQG